MFLPVAHQNFFTSLLWIGTVSLRAPHSCTYYPSPRVPQEIDTEEIEAVWKESGRAWRKVVWAKHPNYCKHGNEWCWSLESMMSMHVESHHQSSGQVKCLPGMTDPLPLLPIPVIWKSINTSHFRSRLITNKSQVCDSYGCFEKVLMRVCSVLSICVVKFFALFC